MEVNEKLYSYLLFRIYLVKEFSLEVSIFLKFYLQKVTSQIF